MKALETPPVEQIAYMLLHRLRKLLLQLEVTPDTEKSSETLATLRAAVVEASHLFKDAHYRAVEEARS